MSTYNIFRDKPIYHHMNQEADISYIPAQSLSDIAYAKALGFHLIEANPHRCSDGVYVCKHGVQGKLGYGLTTADGTDCSDRLISELTSTWIRDNVRYRTYLEKYSGYIPTLDEFCMECKKLSMMVKVGELRHVEVARKYLPDDMIWVTSETRSGDGVETFRGTIEYVWDKSQSIDDCIAKCLDIGAPLNIVIAAGQFNGHTDSEIRELVFRAHINGFTVGSVYPSSNSLMRALTLGVDTIGSTNNNINIFYDGNALNIDALSDAELVLSEHASYDALSDTLVLPAGETVVIKADGITCGKCCVLLRYKGEVTVVCGTDSKECNLVQYPSNGQDTVYLSNVLPYQPNRAYSQWVEIQATKDTTLYDIHISCSKM